MMEDNPPTIPETNDLPPVVPGQEFQAPEVPTNIPPVENTPPEFPPTPKTKGKLTPILLIILIIVLLGVGGLFAYKNFFVKSPEPTPTPASTPEAIPDPTADWETYINNDYYFSLKYPRGLKSFTKNLSGSTVDDNIPLFTIRNNYWSDNPEYAIEVAVWDNPEKKDLLSWLQFLKDSQALPLPTADYKIVSNYKVDNLPALKYWEDPTSNGKQPGKCFQACPASETYFVKDNHAFRVLVAFYTEVDENLATLPDQILSTFKFTDLSPTPTPTTSTNKIKILDTSSWIEYSCNLISYKLPGNYTQQCHVGTDGIYDQITYREKNGYSGSSIFVKSFDGGSRRQNWIDTMQASPSEVSKYVLFQESIFGTVSGLDVFASGGWWQGGYASPILVANDKTIVYIHGGRDYNEVTGKITRWDISDTIASTIKFNK